jgi:hypothetical protein
MGVALVLALAIAATACTSARKREDPTNIVGNLRFRDTDTQTRFAHSYRSAALYQDFRTALLADALAMDLSFRAGYVATMQKNFMLTDFDTANLRRDEDAEFDGNITLLVFLFGGNNRPIPLGDATSPWKVLLEDDDGQTLVPSVIEKLRPENPMYQYLSMYFYGLDRWSQAFKISFPKLDKSALHQAVGTHPVELIITGLAGTTRMQWRDTAMFYRPIEPQAAAPAAAPTLAPAAQSAAGSAPSADASAPAAPASDTPTPASDASAPAPGSVPPTKP